MKYVQFIQKAKHKKKRLLIFSERANRKHGVKTAATLPNKFPTAAGQQFSTYITSDFMTHM